MYNGNFGGYSNDRSLTPPVKEGEELDVTVEAVGEKGDGIAKVQGFVLFVPGTSAGDRVRIKITRVLAKVGFGQKVGEAQSQDSRPEPEPVEEFDPKPELDSESFGDEDDMDDEDSEDQKGDSEEESDEPLDDESEDEDTSDEESDEEKTE